MYICLGSHVYMSPLSRIYVSDPMYTKPRRGMISLLYLQKKEIISGYN